MSCGYDIPARAAPAGQPTPTALIPESPPGQPSTEPWALGTAAVLCALVPIAAYGVVFTTNLPYKGVCMPLAVAAWVVGLALGILANYRGSRRLGSAAIALCVVELLVVVGLFVLGAALYFLGRAIAP